MWGRELLAECGAWVDMVGLCDSNPVRLDRARELIGVDAPLFADLATMLREARPETVIVCSPDVRHDEHITTGARGGLRRGDREADDDDGREVPPAARG
jgi:predicted dehydrogenase